MPRSHAGDAGAWERNPYLHAALRLYQRTPAPAPRGNTSFGHEPHHRRQRPPAHHQGGLYPRGARADLFHRQRRLFLAQGRADRQRRGGIPRQRRTGHLLCPRRAGNGQKTALDADHSPLPRLVLGSDPGLPETCLRRRPDFPRRESRRLALRRRLPRGTGQGLRREDRRRGGQG